MLVRWQALWSVLSPYHLTVPDNYLPQIPQIVSALIRVNLREHFFVHVDPLVGPVVGVVTVPQVPYITVPDKYLPQMSQNSADCFCADPR
jgi:hypothetical protein